MENKVQIIGGSGLENALRELKIIAKLKYKGDFLDVWELYEDDMKYMDKIPEEEWNEEWGWWSYSDGSALAENPTYIFQINGCSMIGYYDEERLREFIKFWSDEISQRDAIKIYFKEHERYCGLRSYLCDVLGVSTKTNTGAVANDIAKLNNLTLAELFNKYGDS